MPRARGGKTVGASGHLRPRLPKQEGEGEDDPEDRKELLADTKTFPEYQVERPLPLTEREKAQVAEYLTIKNRIRKGPLYAVLGDDVRVGKQRGEPVITDPFDGVATYGQRYTVRKRTLPKLDGHPHVLQFFPKELWGTLEPSTYSASGVLRPKRKRSQVSAKLDRMVAENPENPEGKGGQDDEDAEEGEGVAGADKAEEEIDDIYQTDEEDMEGDYNAEAYFDDGGEDAGDDYDAGDGGDESYYV